LTADQDVVMGFLLIGGGVCPMPDAPQDEDLLPFGVGWSAGRVPDEDSLDRELQRVG
jgi:hypothetical protein